MNRLTDQERITAFVDGELDLSEQIEMERRYESEPALSRQVDELRVLRTALRRASCHAAPHALRERLVAAATRLPPSAAATHPARRSLASRWFDWRPMAVSLGAAACVLVVVDTAWHPASGQRRLEDDVVASHVRSTLSQHLVDVSSSDHHQVKPFLSARLGFSPPVDDLPIPGSQFLGGRVDYLDDRPVAALVYQQGPHLVDSFIWPTASSDTGLAFAQEKGFRTAHWDHGGMTHWVISDVNADEFRTVVQAIAHADDQQR